MIGYVIINMPLICSLSQNPHFHTTFVELLKDNMNSQMSGLLLTTPLTSLAEFKREGLRVDRRIKNTAIFRLALQSLPISIKVLTPYKHINQIFLINML